MWDGLAAHRGKLLRAWLGRQRSWLVVEPLPGYPRAQPGRIAVGQPQRTELANLAGDTLEKIIAAAERGIQRIRATLHLPFSFRATADCPDGENHLTGTGDLLRPRPCG